MGHLINFIQFVLQHISVFGAYVLRLNATINTHEMFRVNSR